MTIPTTTFEHAGVKITVRKPSAGTAQKAWAYRRLLTGVEDKSLQRFAFEVCYHVANTLKIEGDLGFSVPGEDATAEELEAFAAAFYEADEALLVKWDNAIYNLKFTTNDPDLLPPGDVDPKGSATPKS